MGRGFSRRVDYTVSRFARQAGALAARFDRRLQASSTCTMRPIIPLIACAATLCIVFSGCGGGSSDPATFDAATPAIDSATIDAAIQNCFPLSGPSNDLPDVIPSSFTAASPTWMRPTGEVCPATGLDETAVPFDTVCYTNDTGAALDVLFEVIVEEEEDNPKPVAVIYEGTEIPASPTQCAAVSSDLVLNAAEAFYTVPTGATITFVASFQDPDTGDFQFVITPE